MRDSELVSALADGWALEARSVSYLPVGAGSHHWAATGDDGRTWFVTVDDLGGENGENGEESGDGEGGVEEAFRGLGRALDTALALRRRAGLAFVVAPVPARTGATVWRLGPRHAVSLFPMLEGQSGQFGAHRQEDRAEVLGLLAELHRATPAVAADAPPADLALPGREGLREALDDLGRPWTGGPLSEPTRRLLAARAGHVERLLGDFDRLVERVRRAGAPPVVTHGEPHPGNLIRSATGLHLVDWDTVRLAPPERDLWMLDGDDDLLTGYTRATGRPVDPSALALYRLWWDLADIAAFVAELRGPHRVTGDIEASWTYLGGYLR
ncbi:hypothetical protein Psi01_72010 [Planobispora siamensis]|uniref:Aminoglycoside phosphotransferase domain-containing protein n=1 Tax=Planobispora siamensis TaxID=936338 RepID=A0A8J3WR77_9ACTN|nr:hypothetical protein Psi01_72010 [Planobispora siamensis]